MVPRATPGKPRAVWTLTDAPCALSTETTTGGDAPALPAAPRAGAPAPAAGAPGAPRPRRRSEGGRGGGPAGAARGVPPPDPLRGRRPFDGGAPPRITPALLIQPAPRLAELLPDCPAGLH